MKTTQRLLLTFAGIALAASTAAAQRGVPPKEMQAMMDQMHANAGQAAFAAIQDIVKRLKADPTTDWSKVDLEGLRRHFVDMDNVFMRSAVKQMNVSEGMSLDITGDDAVAGSIRRMVTMHAITLDETQAYNAKFTEIPGGIRLVVTLQNAGDTKALAMLRGLGFSGMMTDGDHHDAHHMAMAKGASMEQGKHKP
jgi:hypothetical protein